MDARETFAYGLMIFMAVALASAIMLGIILKRRKRRARRGSHRISLTQE